MAGRILIADNVATNRIILKVKLAAASYDVWQTATAQDLIEQARTHSPDLILMDTALPDRDSFETCRDLKTNPQTAAVPVVMVADRYDRDIRLAALRAGAEDVLAKPLDETTLLARVRNLLRAHGMEEELRRRQGTAAEFGFHEAPTEFAKNARVLLIRNNENLTTEWTKAIRHNITTDVLTVNPSQALERIGERKSKPDVILITAELTEEQDCLTLIAELRSRPETRHSAIIVSFDTDTMGIAIAALDMGATDLLEENSFPEEVALRVATQLKRKRNADQLNATLEDGLRLAATDPLTGLFNRRYALPHMSRISAQSQKSGTPFAIMVLDLDRFKLINDTHGHAAGDTVLREIAQRLKNNLRSVDLICRVGGEEFLVVMPDTDLPAAQKTAERLRRVTEADPVVVSGLTAEISVTLSVGVSIGGFDNQASIPVAKIFDRADRALMGAKAHGRNQVNFSQPPA